MWTRKNIKKKRRNNEKINKKEERKEDKGIIKGRGEIRLMFE